MSSQYLVDHSYTRCMYKDCKNGKYSNGKRLFRFPLQKDVRCNIWVSNTGNTGLKKLSANTLRRLGLCEDHFSDTSFVNPGKTRLRRDAIPNPYKKVGSSINEENVEVEKEEQNSVPLSTNDANIMLQEPILSRACPMHTNEPAISNFEMSAEEDVMDLEMPTLQNVKYTYQRYNNIEKKNTKENSQNAVIKKLRVENIYLRRKIRRLNYRLQRMTQAYKDLKD